MGATKRAIDADDEYLHPVARQRLRAAKERIEELEAEVDQQRTRAEAAEAELRELQKEPSRG